MDVVNGHSSWEDRRVQHTSNETCPRVSKDKSSVDNIFTLKTLILALGQWQRSPNLKNLIYSQTTIFPWTYLCHFLCLPKPKPHSGHISWFCFGSTYLVSCGEVDAPDTTHQTRKCNVMWVSNKTLTFLKLHNTGMGVKVFAPLV